jgi:hypothetical protein
MKTLPLGLYQHYKGNYYNVIGLGRHSENLEESVVYQALYGDYGLWVRPLAVFLKPVEIEGKPVPRFTFIRPTFEHPPALRR